jgi:plasmid stabilization system protein ParE
MLRVIYRPEAESEILEAVQFYKARTHEMGGRFLTVLHEQIHDIASSPERFPKVGFEIRQCVVRKFPFIIFFRVHADQVRILAVAHTSQYPHYWKRRK